MEEFKDEQPIEPINDITYEPYNLVGQIKENADKHIKIFHYKIKDKKCDLCDYISASTSHIEIHKKRIHLKYSERFDF
jgi:hypothetical protein